MTSLLRGNGSLVRWATKNDRSQTDDARNEPRQDEREGEEVGKKLPTDFRA